MHIIRTSFVQVMSYVVIRCLLGAIVGCWFIEIGIALFVNQNEAYYSHVVCSGDVRRAHSMPVGSHRWLLIY